MAAVFFRRPTRVDCRPLLDKTLLWNRYGAYATLPLERLSPSVPGLQVPHALRPVVAAVARGLLRDLFRDLSVLRTC